MSPNGPLDSIHYRVQCNEGKNSPTMYGKLTQHVYTRTLTGLHPASLYSCWVSVKRYTYFLKSLKYYVFRLSIKEHCANGC